MEEHFRQQQDPLSRFFQRWPKRSISNHKSQASKAFRVKICRNDDFLKNFSPFFSKSDFEEDNNGLEDGRITKFYHNKVKQFESIIAFLIMLSWGLTIIYVAFFLVRNRIFKKKYDHSYDNDSDEVDDCLLFLLYFSTVLLSIFIFTPPPNPHTLMTDKLKSIIYSDFDCKQIFFDIGIKQGKKSYFKKR